MRKTSVDELVKALKPEVIKDHVLEFSGIGTDTRRDLTGQLFWALIGENFNAHHFLPQAIEKGAKGLVVQELPPNWQIWSKDVTILKVPDTLLALQEYARFIHHKLKFKVVGITGSNGKTSTKEFLAEILKTEMKVHWNRGSFNNHFGLPFNLLGAPDDSAIVIAEMGMNHAGELKRLCEIAEPDVVGCTMVGTAHIEHFGTPDKIAAAKKEIYQYSPAAAIRVFNLDNEWTKKMYDAAPREFVNAEKILTFSQVENKKADVNLMFRKMTDNGLEIGGKIGGVAGEAAVPVYGDHQVTNLAAAATLALAVGVAPDKIWQGLTRCRGAWGRMQFVKSQKKFSILFDGYNANPESMKALLHSIQALGVQGKRFAVLAEMKELGPQAAAEHESLGRLVGGMGFEGVWFYGPSCADFERGMRSVRISKTTMFSDSYKESLASQFASVINPGDLVVVKGSRGMKTEKFVEVCEPLQFQKD